MANFLNQILDMARDHLSSSFGGNATAPGAMPPAQPSPMADAPTGQMFSSPAAQMLGGAMAPMSAPGAPATAQSTRTPQQEAQARQNGFANYDQMLAWAIQRNRQSGGTAPQAAPPHPAAPPPQQPQAQPQGSLFGRLYDAWHNANTSGGR